MLHRTIALLDRHRLAVSIVAGIWFWTGCAVYARFITLPDLPPWIEQAYFWSGAALNGIWYGFLYPRITARREKREKLS